MTAKYDDDFLARVYLPTGDVSTRAGDETTLDGDPGWEARIIRCKNLALYIRDCESLCLSDATLEEEEEEEETLFDPKSTNVQITIPHISDIQFKQLCTHIYRHYVHKHSS